MMPRYYVYQMSKEPVKLLNFTFLCYVRGSAKFGELVGLCHFNTIVSLSFCQNLILRPLKINTFLVFDCCSTCIIMLIILT